VRTRRLGELKQRPVAINRERLRRIIGPAPRRPAGGPRALSPRA
jgi:hypothetical protein